MGFRPPSPECAEWNALLCSEVQRIGPAVLASVCPKFTQRQIARMGNGRQNIPLDLIPAMMAHDPEKRLARYLLARAEEARVAGYPALKEARDRHRPRVYFIQAERGGPIKIGTTVEPQKRLASIQTGHPDRLCILLVIDGDQAKEREMHAQFAAARLSGEWFAPSSDLVGFIVGAGGLPPVVGAGSDDVVEQLAARAALLSQEQRVALAAHPALVGR